MCVRSEEKGGYFVRKYFALNSPGLDFQEKRPSQVSKTKRLGHPEIKWSQTVAQLAFI